MHRQFSHVDYRKVDPHFQTSYTCSVLRRVQCCQHLHSHLCAWFWHGAWKIFLFIVTGVAPCCSVNRMSQAVVMGKRIVGRPRIVTVGQSGVESGRGGLHCCCCACCTCINLQFLRTVEGRLKLCEVVSWAGSRWRSVHWPLGTEIHLSSYRAVNSPRHIHTIHSVRCEQHYRLSAPTCALVYTSCVALLIRCYMFRHNRHLQGAYTSVVRAYSKQIVVQ